jgi:acyl dehydratase
MSIHGHYEDFDIGKVYRHWPGRTIAEYDNTLFALLSMNQNPLFLDDEYAARQPLGRRPVIDTLVFSLTVGMSVADMTGSAIANLGYDSVVFERPLFPGDSLYAESEVLEKRESAANLIVASLPSRLGVITRPKNASSFCAVDIWFQSEVTHESGSSPNSNA